MEVLVDNAARDLPAVGDQGFQVGFDEQVQELIRRGSLDFDTWISLISKIEKIYPDNVEAICSVYDSFLLEFPLCHGYWRKYAAHNARLCTIDKVVAMFERALQSATYCVGVWVEYCCFSMLAYEDPTTIRRLFKRALSFVGKDFLCHPLWDKYIEFEFSQHQWSFLAQIYVQALKFPTKKLHHYYDNFKEFAAILEEEMKGNNFSKGIELESVSDGAVITSKDEISSLIDSLLDPSTGSFRSKALQRYISIGERYYRDASELEKNIHCFETNIRRPYFHVTPLDDDQLENWHRYLDFVEMQEDFDWAVKLYERCLIPCAGYPEFWMRYVEYTESKGGRELAKFALDRATKIFLKNMPEIHLFNAQFKELIGDKIGAHVSFVWSDNESSFYFVEKVVKEANMEKRSGNLAAASAVYEKALKMAAERQKLHTVPVLYVHFSHLKFLMTGNIYEARDVMIDGLRHLPYCKLLLEGLMNFLMMHGGERQVNVVDTIVADAISPRSDASQGLSYKDRQDISVLYLQFVDLCGTIDDIRKAWFRHIKLFPHLIRPTSSVKLPKSGNQLMEMEGGQRDAFLKPDHHSQLPVQEQRPSLPENHALHPNENMNTIDHSQPEGNNHRTEEKLQQLSPKNAECSKEDTSSHGYKSSRDSVHQPAHDLVCETADNAAVFNASKEFSDPINVQSEHSHELEQHLKPLSLDDLTLNGQEMECGDLPPMSSSEHQAQISNMKTENSRNANASPPIRKPGSAQSTFSDQMQNEQVDPSSLTSDHNSLPEKAHSQPEVPTHNLQQQNLAPVHHPHSQISQFPMQSGGQMGYAAYNQAYNQMMDNYFQQQQLMMAQQYYGQQNQQYMQQVQQSYQQQQNLLQLYDQHELYLQQQQQQQQLAQLYYQQLPQLHGQQAQLYHQFMQQHHHGYQHVLQQQQYQLQQTQEQQKEEEWQQQQSTSTQTPTWNGSYYLQPSSIQNYDGNQSKVESGKQIVVPRAMPQVDASSSGAAESPHPPKQSP